MDPTQTDYKIVAYSSWKTVEAEVEGLLRQGWQLAGGITAALCDGSIVWAQAMWRNPGECGHNPDPL